ncbi:uncharacterized protein LOC134187203 [Corticium candelabrum]|uniref:uncharacterized protein LOC134187203 n=1 Tax=Corticium candelabrum TaxID=121492 RepID=UPI002E253F15|nr:uncharacterized protein LOC134187203 [Corticium candelabrum]
MDGVDEDFVRKRVEEGNSHAVISEELQTMFPGLRGLSERSVRRFCTDRGISRRCSLTKEELERCVSDAVSEKLQRRSSALEMSTTLNGEQKKTYASATKLELMSSEVSENSSDNEPPSEGAYTAGRSQLLIRPLPWRAIEATKVFEVLDRKYARR